MNDKAYARHKAQVDRLMKRLVTDLWLGPWLIHVVHERGGLPLDEATGRTKLATCEADWRYQEATITCNCPAMAERSLEELRGTLIHELFHVVIQEMREGVICHEERVVTHLTRIYEHATREKG